MPDALTNFRFTMKSTPPGINIDSDIVGITAFPRIFFEDSIFNFFPRGEVILNDKTGAIVETFFFLESLDFAITIENTSDALFPTMEEILSGKTTVGKLEGNFVWGQHQINNTLLEDHISGHNFFVLESKYKNLDIAKSRAWNYETGGALNPLGAKPISEIARQIAQEFGIVNPLLQQITPTIGNDYWLQPNITSAKFIKNILEKNAFSPVTPKSPFFSFINLKGEFYFMSLQQMYLQKPAATYTLQSLQSNVATGYDDFTIKNFIVQFGGTDMNRDSYTRRGYFVDLTTGLVMKQGLKDYNIHEYQLATEGINKFTIMNQYTQNNYYQVEDYGLCLTPDQIETFLGRQNSYYQDTGTTYRVIIIVRYNPYVVSGKTVNLQFAKTNKLGLISSEFMGSWLVCESKKLCDTSGRAWSQLTLCKGGVIVDPINPYQAAMFGVGV